MTGLLIRGLIALGLIIFGYLAYLMVNRMILIRAERNNLGLEAFRYGKPGILYFTMEGCVPCRTTQRPALDALIDKVGDQVQVIRVDVVEQPELAESWGVLSVPTTFIIDAKGRPRRVNHGVALTEKLIDQLKRVGERELVIKENRQQVEVRTSTSGTG